jgi:NADPH:quinone reductase
MANQAWVADPDSSLTMRLCEIPDPQPASSEAVVKVAYFSLNHGDLNDATSGRIPPGGVLGTDIAGTVVVAAADGRGPAVGQRVAGFAAGGFARYVAVQGADLAVIPDGVEFADAATLPVAGLAALRALRACGSVLGQRVLITGAAGGVGWFAVQLAAAAGADVIASVGDRRHSIELLEVGAGSVVIGPDEVDEPVDVVLDNVGGHQLVAAWSKLAPGGRLQSIGWVSGDPAVLAPYATVGPPKQLSSFLNLGPAGDDLAILLRLLAAGRLRNRIEWRGPWSALAEPVAALRARRLKGKAVLAIPDLDAESELRLEVAHV